MGNVAKVHLQFLTLVPATLAVQQRLCQNLLRVAPLKILSYNFSSTFQYKGSPVMPASLRISASLPPCALLHLIPVTLCYNLGDATLRRLMVRRIVLDRSLKRGCRTLPALTYSHQTRKTPLVMGLWPSKEVCARKSDKYSLMGSAVENKKPWTFFLRNLDFTVCAQGVLSTWMTGASKRRRHSRKKNDFVDWEYKWYKGYWSLAGVS